jgi:hypothetical protein
MSQFYIKERIMSVRATDSLIAAVVVATEIPNSPKMIVQAVNPEQKMITTVWFSDSHESQQGVFPAAALDRYEAKAVSASKKK